MKVSDPVITATQPDPVNIRRVVDCVNVVVFEVDINRPKRPHVFVFEDDFEGDSRRVTVHLTASDDTPPSHAGEQVTLIFRVTGTENLSIIKDSGRYTVDLVFVDRTDTEES
jgi:hypothetical protein